MPRVLTEKHKRAMAAGRKRAAAKRRSGAAKRVQDYRDWLTADVAWRENEREGSKPKMPSVLPSDEDYRVARGEYSNAV